MSDSLCPPTNNDLIEAFTKTLRHCGTDDELVERGRTVDLEFLAGPSAGERLSLTGEHFSIGRGNGQDIRIDDPSISLDTRKL